MDRLLASLGEKIAAAGALVLFIVLFLPWYSVKVEGKGVFVSLDDNVNAWHAFSVVDVLLFLAVATVVAVVVARAAGALPPLPVAPELVLLGASGLALVLVLFRLLVVPEPPASFPEQIDYSRELGVFVAVLAAGAMAYGAYESSREV